MPKTPVAAIVVDEPGAPMKIMLTRREVEPYRGLFCLPGGHIEEYESAETAVVREVKEETNLDFSPRFFHYFDEIIPERDIHAVVLVYWGTATGSVVAQPGEVGEIGWFDVAEAASMDLAFAHAQIIRSFAQELGGVSGCGASLSNSRHV